MGELGRAGEETARRLRESVRFFEHATAVSTIQCAGVDRSGDFSALAYGGSFVYLTATPDLSMRSGFPRPSNGVPKLGIRRSRACAGCRCETLSLGLTIGILSAFRWGAKRIARELGISRNTVKRYVRGGATADKQVRPRARRLTPEEQAEAVRLFDGPAEGNAVVVTRLLRERGIEISVRTCQEYLADHRRGRRAAEVATVRFETAPGHQMQIDFGQKRVRIAGTSVPVHLLVAVLSYSRRLFVKAFLAERQDDWREGIAEAFRHFGGVPQVVLGDNARALVLSRDDSGAVTFHPGYRAFCRDWGVEPRACAPYRARTKGKTESGMKSGSTTTASRATRCIMCSTTT